MSIGLSRRLKDPPPRAITLWAVRKDTRVIRAVVRQFSQGRELAVLVGQASGDALLRALRCGLVLPVLLVGLSA